jgi:hypothetical protein
MKATKSLVSGYDKGGQQALHLPNSLCLGQQLDAAVLAATLGLACCTRHDGTSLQLQDDADGRLLWVWSNAVTNR